MIRSATQNGVLALHVLVAPYGRLMAREPDFTRERLDRIART